MIAFDTALDHVKQLARPLGSERVVLADADGRVLAEDVHAKVDAPPADVSMMDGYAVRAADCETLPAQLTIIRENAAGTSDAGAIAPGQCARIFTGAPLPHGADAIAIQENVRREGDLATIEQSPPTARYIRRRGNDFAAGSVLLDAGTRLGPRQLIAAAAGDHADVVCHQQPRVQVFVNGNELRAAGITEPREGSIPDSLSAGLAASIRRWGGKVCGRQHLADDLSAMQEAASTALPDHDLIVIAGGASVGEYDHARAMFEPFGLELAFAKVAMKPGKPVWLGSVGQCLVMGLPGNPSSAMVTARLLLAPLLYGLTGLNPNSALQWREAKLGQPVPAEGGRETFLRARRDADRAVQPLENQNSGSQLALAQAEVLIRRPANAASLAVGETVPVLEL